MKAILSEEKTSELALKVLDKVLEKALDEVGSKFYDVTKSYLYEHHENFENSIFNEVFGIINGEKWGEFNGKYDAAALRAKIYADHKEELDEMMTDDVVLNSLKRHFDIFLSKDHHTDWRYRDLAKAITNYCVQNYKESDLKDLVPKGMKAEIERLKNKLSSTERELLTLRNEIAEL